MRKLVIANEVSDRMIICITGLQGAGKTTLVKNYFGLDEEIMNIALAALMAGDIITIIMMIMQ